MWHKDWPHKIYVGLWPIFPSPGILLNILKYNGPAWHSDGPHKAYVGQQPIFHGSVILTYILKVNVTDLNCLKILTNGAGQGICAPLGTCCSKINGLYFGVSAFASYHEDCMEECHTCDNGSKIYMEVNDGPHKAYVGQQPIYHGPVILTYILKVNVTDLNMPLAEGVCASLGTCKNICKSVTYILGPVALLNIYMEECHTCDNASMWHKDWTHKIYVGQAKKNRSCVYCNVSGKKWVGRSGFLLFIFFQPKQLKGTYWLSLFFTSINVVLIKEKES